MVSLSLLNCAMRLSLFTAHCSLLSKLQARLAGSFSQRFDAPVIEVAAAIEDHLLDALFDGLLGNGFANLFRRGQIAAGLRLD